MFLIVTIHRKCIQQLSWVMANITSTGTKKHKFKKRNYNL